jgi:GntR family transcriptional regulator
LPSVRNVAADYRVNPLTVLKSYQGLVDEELVEKRRGLGMFHQRGSAEIVACKANGKKFLTESGRAFTRRCGGSD